MSASTSGAFKVLIEEAGLTLAAYRDTAPNGEARPYVTISEAISVVPERHGDEGDPDADQAVTELVQVDLWQRMKGTASYDGRTTDPTEDPALITGLLRLLNGQRPGTAPSHVYGSTVDHMVRLVEPERGVVHHAITVRVRRRLALTESS